MLPAPIRWGDDVKLKYFITVTAVIVFATVVYSVHSQTTPKPLRAFLVTSVMSSPQAGSPYLLTSTFTRAVRADGSWVEIWSSRAGGQDWHERDIHDFTSGILTIVDDMTQSVVTRAIPAHDLTQQRLAAAASCDGTSAGQILGFGVTYTEEKYPITQNPQGDATAVEKRWLAPDLGCFVLRKETTWTRNSDGALLVDTKVTPLTVTFQPVDQLFDVPASYQERTPGEVLRLQATLYPNEFKMPNDTSGIDRSYQLAHDQLTKH
jgi:hypothetical protein